SERFDSYEGFEGQNRHFIAEHYREFCEWWFRLCVPEPHSSRAMEYGLGMTEETTPEVILATLDASGMSDAKNSAEKLTEAAELLRPLAQQVSCPSLVINGELESVALPHWAEALAEDTGSELVVIKDAGHAVMGRKAGAF